MLQQIRKTAESTPVKIILILLAVSFAFSMSDRLSGPSNKEVATFKDIDPITYNDFAKARALAIRQIQQNSNEPVSEEQIQEMGINQSIMQNLVSNKLLEFLAYKFDLDFSDKVLADFIRSLPMFRNANNEFDIDRFKSYLQSQNITEDEYSNEIRNALSKNIIMGSLVNSSYVSDARIKNIISYMSEMRKIDVASISLTPQASNDKIQNFALADLQNFYKENNDLFKTQEVRDVCYAKLDASVAKGKAQKDIDSWIIETSKALSDEVAGGATLQEIAKKYNLKRICEKNITSDNIETRADGLFTNFIPQISEMSDQEVSHPLEMPNGKGQILLEISRLSPEQIKDFTDVQDDVQKAYAAFIYKQNTLKKLQDLATSTSAQGFTKDATSIGMNIISSKDYTRGNLSPNVSFPREMLSSMFASNPGTVTGPFITDENAYIFIVRSIGYDKKFKAGLAKDSISKIASTLREGMFDELMIHATALSKMKINKNFEQE